MKYILVGFILFLSVFNSSAQTVTSKFLNKKMKEVSEKKAKYIETTSKYEDGKTETEIKEIKSGKIYSRSTYRGIEPFGVSNSRGKIIDYDFEVNYKDTICKGDSIEFNVLLDNDSLNYKAPKISSGEIDLNKFLALNLNYPNYALENGIQGKVILRFMITKEGKVENISVVKGVDIILDKEAVRVIRSLKLLSPVQVNGESKNVCFTLPITFRTN